MRVFIFWSIASLSDVSSCLVTIHYPEEYMLSIRLIKLLCCYDMATL